VIPENKPRYLMGVGSPEDIVKAIARGVDCFDSIFPARTARHGRFFTNKGYENIDSAKHKLDINPLDKKCECFVCKNYSRSYMHHLFRTKEENGQKWLSYHNIFFVQALIKRIRNEIKKGTFSEKKMLKSIGSK